MTKDEVKREHKENDGNPEVKRKRKEVHQEILNSAENASQSDVVIKNPTHLAIGLAYKPGITALPVVTVKGSAGNARFILKIAEKEYGTLEEARKYQSMKKQQSSSGKRSGDNNENSDSPDKKKIKLADKLLELESIDLELCAYNWC